MSLKGFRTVRELQNSMWIDWQILVHFAKHRKTLIFIIDASASHQYYCGGVKKCQMSSENDIKISFGYFFRFRGEKTTLVQTLVDEWKSAVSTEGGNDLVAKLENMDLYP